MASSSEKSAAQANLLGKRKPGDDLETKPIVKKHKDNSEEKDTTKGFADSLQQIKGTLELLETKSDEANLISETLEGLDETPDFVEEAAVSKKTLYVGHLPLQTEISDIIDFFEDVGEVVRVRLTLNHKGRRVGRPVRVQHKRRLVGCGVVEFASANEAKKALQKKQGEYLHDCKIFLHAADEGATYLPPKYCIDHKVWYEDYLGPESLLIEEDETPDFAEEVLLIANLSPQTTKIVQIIYFFKDVGEVVSVRLIVNHEGKHMGYGFVEFASAYEAKKALEEKNGEYLHDHKILLMKGLDETPYFVEEVATVRTKTLFVANLSCQTEISHIINFFKDVGEVVHVRLIVDRTGKHVGYGFVEFASANEAKKALEKKNGEYLHNGKIILDVVKTAQYPPRPMYCIDHKVWYEDYLRRESLLIEDAAGEGVDETPDFAEEVAVRKKKTVFVAKIADNVRISIPYIIKIFKDVGQVVCVRLIVDHWGEHVRSCFVEFASANEAKRAVQEKDGSSIFVNVADKGAPYPFRPKYNLAEKLWYEDNLRRESLDLDTKPKQKVTFCGKKITFSDED